MIPARLLTSSVTLDKARLTSWGLNFLIFVRRTRISTCQGGHGESRGNVCIKPLTGEIVHRCQFPYRRRVPAAGPRWLVSPLLAKLGFRMTRHRRGGSMLGIISACPEPGTLCPFTPSLHPPWSASVQPQEQQDGRGPSAVAGELAWGQPLRAGIGTLQEPRMQTAPSVSHRAAYSPGSPALCECRPEAHGEGS